MGTKRELFMLVDAWTVNRYCDSRLCPTHLLAIAEEHAQLVGYGADAVACPALLAQQNEESLHIDDLELGELLHAGVLEDLPEALSNGSDRSYGASEN